MSGANFYSLYLYIDVLKSPIQRCPTSLVEVVQYHLGHYLDTGYGETEFQVSGNECGDYYGVRSRDGSPCQSLR